MTTKRNNWYNGASMSDMREDWLGERGMVSFLVTMIMMIVITLIVIGFTDVTRRNARESLDRQLSSQAFYAAESGINVTQKQIAGYVAVNGYASLPTKTSCTSAVGATDYDPSVAAGQGAVITALGTGVSYTCVLVNPTPGSLQFSATQSDSAVLPISTTANIKSLTIAWSKQNGGSLTTCAGGTDAAWQPAAAWSGDCDLGVLRLDIVKNPSTTATDYNTLYNNTVQVVLTPRGTHTGASAGAIAFGNAAIKGYIISGVDNTTGTGVCVSGVCKATITFPDDAKSYQIRATTLYKDAQTVTITGTTDTSAPNAAQFYGAQAVVDVTGKDQDELRRVQARIALSNSASGIPNYAMSSAGDICKNFSILPTASVDFSTAGNCN